MINLSSGYPVHSLYCFMWWSTLHSWIIWMFVINWCIPKQYMYEKFNLSITLFFSSSQVEQRSKIFSLNENHLIKITFCCRSLIQCHSLYYGRRTGTESKFAKFYLINHNFSHWSAYEKNCLCRLSGKLWVGMYACFPNFPSPSVYAPHI